MLLTFVVNAFLLAGFICLIGVAAFMWLNSRESSLDNKTYEQDYDVRDDIHRQYTYRETENLDPQAVLRRYSMQHARPEKPLMMKVRNPSVVAQAAKHDPDVVDAEVLDKDSADEAVGNNQQLTD